MRFLFLLLLAGCASTSEPIIITKTEYVTRMPPSELLVLPEKVEPVDMRHATQADASRYLIDVYNRMVELENNVIGISRFFAEDTNDDTNDD